MAETNKAGVCCSVFFVFMGIVGIWDSIESPEPSYGFIIIMLGIGLFGLFYYYGMPYVEFGRKNFGDFETRVARRWNRKGWSEVAYEMGYDIGACEIKAFESNYLIKRKKCGVVSMPLGNNRMRQTYTVKDVTLTFRVVEFVYSSKSKREENDSRIESHFRADYDRQIHFTQDNIHIAYGQKVSPPCREAEYTMYSYELDEALKCTVVHK